MFLKEETSDDELLAQSLSNVRDYLFLQFESYLGEHYSNYWLNRVAEFLDPRTFGTLSFDDIAREEDNILELVKPLWPSLRN